MEFKSLTFCVTDDCNQRCTYCYQKKSKRYLDPETIQGCLDALSPFFADSVLIRFYGGEPLLNLAAIRHTLATLRPLSEKKSKITYSITTNGSLLNHEILRLLNDFNFEVGLSFDGIAQDISRQPGSLERMLQLIRKIQEYDGIVLRTHSVFTPETVGKLFDSMRLICDTGVASAGLSLAYNLPWTETALDRLRGEMEKVVLFSADTYRRSSAIPIPIYNRNGRFGTTVCPGGQSDISLAPDNTLWGCVLLYDFARKSGDGTISQRYSFGKPDRFVRNYESVYSSILYHYSQIRLDGCRTWSHSCLECLDYPNCSVCPLAAAFGSLRLGIIPGWVCSIKKIFQRANEAFWQEIGKLNQGTDSSA